MAHSTGKAQEHADRISRQTLTEYLFLQSRFNKYLRAALRDAARDGERRIRALEGTGYAGDLRATQLRAVVRAIKRAQAALWDEVRAETELAVQDAVLTASEGFSRFPRFFRNPSLADSFQAAADQAALNLQSSLRNRFKFSKRVYKNEALAKRKIEIAVNRGVALNMSTRELAQSVKGLISPDVPGGISYAANRLGRTEMNNAYHETSIRTYQNQPWVKQVKWNLSGSHPHSRPDVCDDYARTNNGLFMKDSVPSRPHPQCMCYITPVVMEDEEFLDWVTGRMGEKWRDSQ